MNTGILAVIAYGLLALVGGFMAYLKVKSKASIISGSISGLLLLGAGLMAWQGITFGITLAQIVTAALVIVFSIRLFKTRKFMPAGLMLIAGIITFSLIYSFPIA